jgi:hypothetical protein
MLDVSEWWRRKGAGSSLQERPELLGLWLIIVLVPASLPPHHDDLHESRIKILRADAGIELFKASPPKHPSLLSPLSDPPLSANYSNFTPSPAVSFPIP